MADTSDAPFSPPRTPAAETLLTIARRAIEAVHPFQVIPPALDRLVASRDRPPWIVALGKAAGSMARAAVEWLAARGRAPAGGIAVVPVPEPALPGSIRVVVGDHPMPGTRSQHAAVALAECIEGIPPRDPVWVLLSGGASSLLSSPLPGLNLDHLFQLTSFLLASGRPIGEINAVRKLATRWGAGRLAQALAPRPIRQFVISDVPGDELAAIGSGPCVADPRAVDLARRLWDGLPRPLGGLLQTAWEGSPPPDSGDPCFADIVTEIVATNAMARRAAAAAAADLGLDVVGAEECIQGKAREAGEAFAVRCAEAARSGTPRCLIAGGEPTVTLEAASSRSELPLRLGGRCQEFALGAAGILARAKDPLAITILAIGTDGRDGPTDAAGAVVDGTTWERISAAGLDPAASLAGHTTYHALAAAGALVHTGPTGTNVMDLMLGLSPA